ncbi:hypothetical protein [Paenibacillus sacheonensis]|uniref:Glycosyl hydrolase family 32 N-terminal domain-containing protein n=1 Tax=Paenibacillus sacheonensis TaxID=742054 RepID=A0A7X4YPV0_9BACL|nr:hypothetical protein [Paenibacillus sacheonensis]MBM7564906.1 putative GH43/DUF377 family glycosyl hydrolase [Paenibacillus sacheonensis]NBC70303.1 hypothetical protein [Paenibacillus sacheonensis]
MTIVDRASIDALRTEYRLGVPVLSGSGAEGRFDAKAVDCPFVFRHAGLFYMMYVGYDGEGYQTALASSADLVNWTFQGLMLERLDDPSRWDRVGAAGSWMLLESDDLHAVPTLQKVDGKYWMIYHSYPDVGYEAGGAVMGLAYCEDEALLNWTRLDRPVFTYEGGADWERGGLYKCCVVRQAGTYWMFYNAKEKDEWPWTEQIGAAWSTDLIHWTRSPRNPLLPVREGSFYRQFLSDPCIKYHDGRWYNFAFGFDGEHSQGALAVSEDLARWETMAEPWLPAGGPGELDETHAHKSSVLSWNGTLYHFYCACRPAREGDPTVVEYGAGIREFRCITVASSRAWGEGGLEG